VRRALIHRDLKPGNIFLVRNDVVKVLDFGIAKSVAAAPPPTFHTATGLVIGTLDYMSPEQCRGGMPHPSWDIWALAVIAYEMLVGECPFTETNSYDFRRTVAPGSWIHLANRHSDVPDSTHAIFARAFSVDPAERPGCARTLLDDMERALND
jgi:serine/threonine protein kinase